MKTLELKENEIIVDSLAVKYTEIEYHDNYIVVVQNRIRRRVYKGYYFDDDGVYVWLSSYVASMFQHKKKVKKFILNKETKEFSFFQDTIVQKHVPIKKESIFENTINDLKR